MEDGSNWRDHLKSEWRQLGFAEAYKPAQLDYPFPPIEAKRVWDKFQQLSQRRNFNEVGPEKINWREIEAWLNTRKSSLQPWELDAIIKLDDTFIEVWFENNK